MNGRSDTGEMFTRADFQTVLSFAETSQLGRFSFWSVNRDRECSWLDNMPYVSGSAVSFNGHNWTANQWNYDEVPEWRLGRLDRQRDLLTGSGQDVRRAAPPA